MNISNTLSSLCGSICFGKYLKRIELNFQWVEFIFIFSFFQISLLIQSLRVVYPRLSDQMITLKDNNIAVCF